MKLRFNVIITLLFISVYSYSNSDPANKQDKIDELYKKAESFKSLNNDSVIYYLQICMEFPELEIIAELLTDELSEEIEPYLNDYRAISYSIIYTSCKEAHDYDDLLKQLEHEKAHYINNRSSIFRIKCWSTIL